MAFVSNYRCGFMTSSLVGEGDNCTGGGDSCKLALQWDQACGASVYFHGVECTHNPPVFHASSLQCSS